VEPPVAYECKSPSHQVGEGGPDRLTVHLGKWAFCPFDAKAEGHQWMATGGLPLSMLRHGAVLRARDKSGVT
jgi:hypothetical protein